MSGQFGVNNHLAVLYLSFPQSQLLCLASLIALLQCLANLVSITILQYCISFPQSQLLCLASLIALLQCLANLVSITILQYCISFPQSQLLCSASLPLTCSLGYRWIKSMAMCDTGWGSVLECQLSVLEWGGGGGEGYHILVNSSWLVFIITAEFVTFVKNCAAIYSTCFVEFEFQRVCVHVCVHVCMPVCVCVLTAP